MEFVLGKSPKRVIIFFEINIKEKLSEIPWYKGKKTVIIEELL